MDFSHGGAPSWRYRRRKMKFEIKNQYSGFVIFSLETDSLKLCVEVAIKSGSDLSGAYLSWADLSGSDLSGADLSKANLSKANLSWADLSGSDLSGAYLSWADLSGSDLSKANLSGSDLSGAKNFNKHLTTPLRILYDQPGPIRAYKLVNERGEGPYAVTNGYAAINYFEAEEFSVQTIDEDENKQCGAGINLASLDWCMKEWKPNSRILIMEFFANEPKGNLCVPTATDGKFRVKHCRKVGEKDLKEIGLLK